MDPLKLNEDDVSIIDIAHSLSKLCRYTGHCYRFYSVAEHSWRVADYLRRKEFPKPVQLVGLLHDASEAYIGDITTPLKRKLWVETNDIRTAEKVLVEFVANVAGLDLPPTARVTRIEDRILEVILRKCGAEPAFLGVVKEADTAVFHQEWGVLMGERYAPPPRVIGDRTVGEGWFWGWSPEEAVDSFLQMYVELGGK